MITAVHTLIYSDDAPATRAFFRDVLGWPFVEHAESGQGWLIFQTGPSELGVHPTSGTHGGKDWSTPRQHSVSLMCDDIEATRAELEGKGASFAGDVERLRLRQGADAAGPGHRRHPALRARATRRRTTSDTQRRRRTDEFGARNRVSPHDQTVEGDRHDPLTALADRADLLVDSTTVHVEQPANRRCPTPGSCSSRVPSSGSETLSRIEQDGRYAVDGCLDSEHAHGRIEEVACSNASSSPGSRTAGTPPPWSRSPASRPGDGWTRVSAHVEDVPEQVGRDTVSAHWQDALDRLVAPAAATADHGDGSASYAA